MNREFWVNPDRDAATEVETLYGATEMQIVFCASVEPIDDDSIKVIEYSAYEDELELHKLTTRHMKEIKSERDRYKAALERICAEKPTQIDGMIIADMGFRHFAQFTAETALGTTLTTDKETK